jgi:hypothetical protein
MIRIGVLSINLSHLSLLARNVGSPHAQAHNVEVGGQRGREAIDRLRNVVGRIESSWRPASAEEGFEIVRRLFEPTSDGAIQGSGRSGTGLRGFLPVAAP